MLGKLFGTNITSAVDAVGNAFDKIFTSDEERLKAQIVLDKIKQQPSILQGEINKLEAQHRSIFVAGWRPFIGWICGISLGAYFIPQFVFGSYLWLNTCLAQHTILPYPIKPTGLIDLVLALLGLGALRTAEKFGNKTK